MAWLLNGYRFTTVAEPATLVALVAERAAALSLTGTVLIAGEGVNVAVFGARPALVALRDLLEAELGAGLCDELWTELPPASRPFRRLRVRLRAEIVTLGQPLPALGSAGTVVPPAEWDALLATPGVRVVDVRNEYESRLGTFASALLPDTAEFSAFPAWAETALVDDLDAPVAMFCTGGIRCVKAAAWLEARGFRDVRRLAGGVLGYLATPNIDHNAWRGDCFVFDDRPELPGRSRATPER